jgi:methyltransferase-like protein/SAM-dependent methyltransferase
LVAPADQDAVDRLRADYDATPYTSMSFPPSAPGQLAAVAHLLGLSTAPVSSARVLEIGCATGGNIIPFAAAHPQARIVGLDLSQVQVDLASTRAGQLGLDNVKFVAGDIARQDLTALGQFDFIVAHGVYSWVPPEVQDALLAAFRALLAPDGVAYLSYNVYPGWKTKEVLRDAMLLASGGSATPQDRAREARDIVDFLEEVAPGDSVLARVLAEFRAHSEGFGDSYLLHEELETFNDPCYFSELLARARSHGLAFLGEARPEAMFPGNYGPTVEAHLREKCGGVQVVVEQYIDFVVNRMFRESLLVHGHREQQIRYNPDRSLLHDMHIAAWVPPVDGPSRLDSSRQEYREADGATLFTNDPGIKAALDALSDRWPSTLSRQELVDAVRARLVAAGLTPSDSIPDLVDNLMGVLILQGQSRYRLDPVSLPAARTPLLLDATVRRMVASTPSQTPASAFNLWHETHLLSEVDRHLLPMLDGTLDRDALVEAIVAVDDQNPIPIERDGAAVLGASRRREVLAEEVDTLPQRLADMKLVAVP